MLCFICQSNEIMIGRNVLVENFSFDVYFWLPYSIPLEATHILMRRNDVCSHPVFFPCWSSYYVPSTSGIPRSLVDVQTINSRNLHRGAWVVPRQIQVDLIGLSPILMPTTLHEQVMVTRAWYAAHGSRSVFHVAATIPTSPSSLPRCYLLRSSHEI